MDLITNPGAGPHDLGLVPHPGLERRPVAPGVLDGGRRAARVAGHRRRPRPHARHNIRATLDERLARGDLSPEEYREHREALR